MTDRYWIDDNPIVKPFPEGSNYAVVDEVDGGIVAYFNTQWRAESFIHYWTGEL